MTINNQDPESPEQRRRAAEAVAWVSNLSASRQFAAGLRAPWIGAQFLRQHRQLWRHALPPVLLNLLITTLVFLFLLTVAVWFATHAHGWFVADRSGWELAMGIALGLVAAIALFLLCVAVAVIVWRLLTGILCGYQYGKLAARTERLLGLSKEQITPITFRQQAADVGLDLSLLAGIQATCLLIGLIPFVGAPVAFVAGFYRTSMLLGMDFLDYPLSLRGMGRIARRSFGWRHRWATFGFGTCVFVLSCIPIVSAFLLTTAVIGAVLLHRELGEEALPSVVDREQEPIP